MFSIRFLCANCNKSFLILSQLKDHVDKGVCTEEKRRCAICSKVLYNFIALQLYNSTTLNNCIDKSESKSQSKSQKGIWPLASL